MLVFISFSIYFFFKIHCAIMLMHVPQHLGNFRGAKPDKKAVNDFRPSWEISAKLVHLRQQPKQNYSQAPGADVHAFLCLWWFRGVDINDLSEGFLSRQLMWWCIPSKSLCCTVQFSYTRWRIWRLKWWCCHDTVDSLADALLMCTWCNFHILILSRTRNDNYEKTK